MKNEKEFKEFSKLERKKTRNKIQNITIILP